MFAHLAELWNKAGAALYQLQYTALKEDWVYHSVHRQQINQLNNLIKSPSSISFVSFITEFMISLLS